MSEKAFYLALKQRVAEEPNIILDVVEQLVRHARKGRQWAIKEFINRTDGKPVQQTELTGKDGADLFASMSTEQLRERAKQIISSPEFMRSLQ